MQQRMECFTLPLDEATGKSMRLYFYTNVRNAKEIREKCMTGRILCSAIRASLVIDPFHIAIAANKAALREHRSRLTTKSIYTEILYAMSISGKITDSLAKFGIHDDDENIIFVTIHPRSEANNLDDELLKQINGERAAILRIREFTDVTTVRKMYKIEEDELAVSSLLYSVVSRISGDIGVSLK